MKEQIMTLMSSAIVTISIIVGFVLAFTVLLIFIAYIMHDKRKFDAINKYNYMEHVVPTSKTYEESLRDHHINVNKSGVECDKKLKAKICSVFKALYSHIRK